MSTDKILSVGNSFVFFSEAPAQLASVVKPHSTNATSTMPSCASCRICKKHYMGSLCILRKFRCRSGLATHCGGISLNVSQHPAALFRCLGCTLDFWDDQYADLTEAVARRLFDFLSSMQGTRTPCAREPDTYHSAEGGSTAHFRIWMPEPGIRHVLRCRCLSLLLQTFSLESTEGGVQRECFFLHGT